MRWRSFFLWNALGGICWATAIGLLAYFLGNAAGNAIQTFGLFGLFAVLVLLVGLFVAHRRHSHGATGERPGDSGETTSIEPERVESEL
jgi:membrane protein DedA with SNARE-associated domain